MDKKRDINDIDEGINWGGGMSSIPSTEISQILQTDIILRMENKKL